MILDVFMYFLTALMVFFSIVSARYFWITRPMVVYDVREGRWRAQRGLERGRH